MIVRTWACLNRYCLNVFDMADRDHPPCVRCGGLRVKWVPKPVGILSQKTKQTDRDVRQLQEVYGDKNYNSPRRNERVAPKVNPPQIKGKTMKFSPSAHPGWAADVPIDQNGTPVAICAPTGVTAKIRPTLNERGGVTKVGGKALGVGGRFEASHRPPGGVQK